MLAQIQSPLGLLGRVRTQVWVFLGVMTIAGVLMALGVIYLTPAYEDPTFAPAASAAESDTLVQSRG
jgi:hypothetical protein